VLHNALDTSNHLGVSVMRWDTIVAQRIYLSMMESKLAHLEDELATTSSS
jgi:hypothetical protein